MFPSIQNPYRLAIICINWTSIDFIGQRCINVPSQVQSCEAVYHFSMMYTYLNTFNEAARIWRWYSDNAYGNLVIVRAPHARLSFSSCLLQLSTCSILSLSRTWSKYSQDSTKLTLVKYLCDKFSNIWLIYLRHITKIIWSTVRDVLAVR